MTYDTRMNAIYGGFVELGFGAEHFNAARIAFDRNPDQLLSNVLANLAWRGNVAASDSFQFYELRNRELRVYALELLEGRHVVKDVAKIALEYGSF